MKLSPWWDGSIKPERDGIYKRNYNSVAEGVWYSKYIGNEWYGGFKSRREAHSSTETSCWQNLPWRGILK